MVLSKREKYIGIGAAAAIAILVLDQFVISPYFDAVDQLNRDLTKASQQVADNSLVFERQHKLQAQAATASASH